MKNESTVDSYLAFLVIALFVVPFPALAADDKKTTFSQAELDQMMAPVALYPDSLLSQILMASTYPDQVSEAVEWSKKTQTIRDRHTLFGRTFNMELK